jgi:hypothetical protein
MLLADLLQVSDDVVARGCIEHRRGFSASIVVGAARESWACTRERWKPVRRILIDRHSEQLQDLQRMPALLPQRIGDRSNQLLREHVVSFRSEVHPIGPMWFAAKHWGSYQNDPDAHSS